MNILVAPDSFKESLSAVDVCKAIKEGIDGSNPDANVWEQPLSDGGEGLTEVIVKATAGTMKQITVTGPLGEPVKAFWGLSGDGETAVIEMAAASGLMLVPPARRDPFVTTTYGTGELILAALQHQVKKVILGIGGSSTNDAGMGMAKALGVKFVNQQGSEVPEGAKGLLELAAIDSANLDPRIKKTQFAIVCDVTNPLSGPRGAAYVYAPQKGAAQDELPVLDKALKNFATVVQRDLARDIDSIPGAGAAGGLGAGALLFLDGKLESGIEVVMRMVGFSELLVQKKIDLVITGEGQVNEQSCFGKVVAGVAKIAVARQIPVVVIAGGIGPGADKLYKVGITAITSIVNRPMTLTEAMENTYELLKEQAATIMRLIEIGYNPRDNNI